MRITQGLFLTVAIALAQPPLKFDVASVKPFKDDGAGSRNTHANYNPQGIEFGAVTLAFAIAEAYHVPPGGIQGPGSLTKENLWAALRTGYDIVAKADHPVSKDQLLLMLQSLLADRFHLRLHRESRIQPIYQLTVAADGPKLAESPDAGASFTFARNSEGYVFRNADMIRLIGFLSGQTDRTVVDQTGLKSHYDFILKMPQDAPSDAPSDAPVPKTDGRTPDSPSTAAFRDALKRLGLQLIAGRAPVEYLVIDHVEPPSSN